MTNLTGVGVVVAGRGHRHFHGCAMPSQTPFPQGLLTPG
jgi:hypothetical protein